MENIITNQLGNAAPWIVLARAINRANELANPPLGKPSKYKLGHLGAVVRRWIAPACERRHLPALEPAIGAAMPISKEISQEPKGWRVIREAVATAVVTMLAPTAIQQSRRRSWSILPPHRRVNSKIDVRRYNR